MADCRFESADIMEMNETRIRILNYLVQQKQFTTYRKIAEQFHMTDRMARKHVDSLEAFLRAKGLGGVERKYGSGVRIQVTPALNEAMLQWQSKRTPYQYVYSQEERNEIILALLLFANEPIRQKDLSRKLNVSGGTIVRQMDQVQGILEARGLTLVRKPNVGTAVRGGELERQLLLVRIYRKHMNFGSLKAFMRGDITHIDGSQLMETLFSRLHDRGRAVMEGVHAIERSYALQFGDNAFVQVFLVIAILVCRILAGARESGYRPAADAHLPDSTEPVALLVENIERQYGVRIADTDRAYIIAALCSGKTVFGSMQSDRQDKQIAGIVQRMITLYEEVSGAAFGSHRAELADGLTFHLKHVICAIRCGLPLGDDVPDCGVPLDKDYIVYTKMCIGELERYIGQTLSEREIFLIAVQFGAMELKILKEQQEKDRILLVCGSGVGISNLIAIQLHQQFQLDTIITASSRQFHEIPRESYRYVISTIEIEGLPPQDYVLISPRYTLDDQKKIAAALGRLSDRRPAYEQTVAMSTGLLKRLERHVRVADKQQLQCEFIDELTTRKRTDDPHRDAADRSLNLWDVVCEATVQLGFHASDWQSAVRQGARLLEDTGAVDESYVDAIIANIQRMGPYMAIMPQVFLSHAENAGNVHSVAVSILTLDEGICVGQPDCDPIRLVVTLAATDASSHLRAIAQLFSLLRERESVNRIIKCQSKAAIMKMISQMRQEGTYNGRHNDF